MSRLALFFAVVLLAACSHNTQTTSGTDYLLGHYADPTQTAAAGTLPSFEETLRQVAAVEPTLRFPARIGLAKIDHGQLSALTEDEVKLWTDSFERLGPSYGEFVPVNPLVERLVETGLVEKGILPKTGTTNIIQKIRLGAARQHLDAVLIYEVYSKSSSRSNALRLTDLTIIGAFLFHSRDIETEAFGAAMLIDVLQGYPYGTVSTTASEKEATTLYGKWDVADPQADRECLAAVEKLTAESEQMFSELKGKLDMLAKNEGPPKP
jgi:hypothetical protein